MYISWSNNECLLRIECSRLLFEKTSHMQDKSFNRWPSPSGLIMLYPLCFDLFTVHFCFIVDIYWREERSSSKSPSICRGMMNENWMMKEIQGIQKWYMTRSLALWYLVFNSENITATESSIFFMRTFFRPIVILEKWRVNTCTFSQVKNVFLQY